MFRTSVHQSVLQAIDQITKEKGVRGLTDLERQATFRSEIKEEWRDCVLSVVIPYSTILCLGGARSWLEGIGHKRPGISNRVDDGRRPRFFPRLQQSLGWFKSQATTDDQVNYLQDLEDLYPINAYSYDNGFDPDPLTGCIASLESLTASEMGMIQILFQPSRNPWAENAYRSIMDSRGDPFFVNAPEMIPFAKEKFSSPLFSTVIWLVGNANYENRAGEISRELARSLISFNRIGSNELVPLGGELSCDFEDLINRTFLCCPHPRQVGSLSQTAILCRKSKKSSWSTGE